MCRANDAIEQVQQNWSRKQVLNTHYLHILRPVRSYYAPTMGAMVGILPCCQRTLLNPYILLLVS